MTACSPSCLGRLAYVARIPLAQQEEPSCCRRGTRPSPCPWRRPPCDDPPSSSRPLPTHRASSCAGSSRSASSPARAAPDQKPSGAACIGERLHDSLRGCKVGGKANQSIRKRIGARTTSYLFRGSHFSLFFLFVRDLCPRPFALAAADCSDRFWHVSTPQFLTITLSTSFSSTIVLLPATA